MSRIHRRKKGGQKSAGPLHHRKSQQFIVRPSGVSHALWPPHVRRYLATSRIAQQRRLMIIKGLWCFRNIRPFPYKQQVKQLLSFHSTFRIYLLYTTLAIAFLVIGVSLAIFLLHPWPVTALLVLLWIITIALTMRLWYTCLRMSLVARQSSRPAPKPVAPPITKPITPLLVPPSLGPVMPDIAKTRPIVTNHSIDRPIPVTRPLFLATPMPPTPLVRVLETIDLSTTNVEHFLDARQEPRSQLGDVSDTTALQMDEHSNKHPDIHTNEQAQQKT